MAKRGKESAPETGLVKPVDPLLDAPAEVNVPPVQPGRVRSVPTFGQRVGRFFGFLVRVVISVIILSAFVMVLYLGLPLLNERYVEPVEQNTSNLAELRSRQGQTEQQLADLQTRLQTLETVQYQHDQWLTDLDQRMGDLETEIAARTESLAALEDLQAKLQTQSESVSAELERQIALLKSMELLSRARLFLYESNFGLARHDVQTARDLLAEIEPDASGAVAQELREVLVRLDLTLSNLPNFPVAASDDLDIAWQILLSGLPDATPTATITPTSGNASPTPRAADMTITPTAQATIQPSATP